MAKPSKRGGQNYAKLRKEGAREKHAAAEAVSVSPTQITQRVVSVNKPQQHGATATGNVQTLQQQRAGYALETIKSVSQDPQVDQKEFRSYAAGFPAMVRMNGLGQAAAFYYSQGDSYRKLYGILSGWLIQPQQPYAGKTDLLAGITEGDMHSYRIAQAEALLLLDWVKRFAKAFMREA